MKSTWFLWDFVNRQAISVGNFVERLLRGSRAIDAEAVTSVCVNYNDLEVQPNPGIMISKGKYPKITLW